GRARPRPAQAPSADPPGISLIVCVRNEAENLRRHLPSWLDQDYPNYELVIVDDGSTDESVKIILEYSLRFPTLRLVRLAGPTRPGKKEALARGISAARFELLLVTDADCRPLSRKWISLIAGRFSANRADLVLGYSPYAFRPGWLNRFQRYETVYTAIQYLSLALAGHPYMGVGRNLAYRHSLYERVGGFAGHGDLMSGDDDLFVNAASGLRPRVICELERESFVQSAPGLTWRGYYRQKFRHNTAGSRYRPVHQFLLGSLAFSHAAIYLLGGWLLLGPAWPFIAALHLVRLAVIAVVWRSALDRLNGQRDLLRYLPFLDALYVGYYFLFVPALMVPKSHQHWK
ncbi:MAG: glycosyltransferase, partial [Saprospiraceae bacterium]